MHAIKGGWVGQTFALAKRNESEGRKSRIRRSKEERKAMVESFIKKYQKLNNGSFPSLNLTHKEVGGSFYTVREIVRDIIQENRVLGPAKLIQEDESNSLFEQGPLGSIALEPHYISTGLSNDSEFATNEYQISEVPSLVFDGHQSTTEHHIFGNGKVINGTPIDTKMISHGELKESEMLEVVELEKDGELDEDEDLVSDASYASPEPMNDSLVDVRTKESNEVKNEESVEGTQKELLVDEASEAESVKEESIANTSSVTPITGDVKVETFPMRPVTTTNDLDGKLSEVNDMTNTFNEQGIEKVELFTGVTSSHTDGLNSSLDKKGVTTKSDPSLDKHTGLVEERVDPLLGSNCLNGGAGHEIQDLTDDKVEVPSNDLISVTSEQSMAVGEAKAVNSPIGVKTKYEGHSNGTTTELKIEEELTEKERDIQHSGKHRKENTPTLDRMNLESWDGASKKSGPQSNPLWAAFKAFMNAFVKFLTE